MLVFNQFNLVEHFVDLFCHAVNFDSLKSCIEFKMFSDSEVVEKYIMLGTDAQIFS